MLGDEVYPLVPMLELPAAFLCLPTSDDGSARVLRRKVRLVALKELLTFSGASLGPRAEASIRRVQAVLQRAVKADAGKVLSAVGQPDVQVPLLVMASGLRGPHQVAAGMMGALFGAIANGGVPIDEALLWEHPIERLAIPGQGTVGFDRPAKALLVDASGLAVELSDGRRVDLVGLDAEIPDGVRVISREVPVGEPDLGLHLSLADTNPLALEEAHPDKDGNALSLGSKSLGEWTQALEEALNLVKVGLPEWYAELKHTTVRLLPVGFEPEMHLSASYREAPGIVYLTLHPDPLTMAEALVHETQHGKLNLLSWLDPVLHNAYTAWSESPVRPDLRPVMGVLLAVHAFVPVAALHARLAAIDHPVTRTHRFGERRNEVLAGNAGGMSVVQGSAEPTKMGGRVIDGLATLHERLAGLGDSAQWDSTAMPPG
jgi:HEXXH motif-containing protein